MTNTQTCNHEDEFVQDSCKEPIKEKNHEHEESFLSRFINSPEAKAIGTICMGLGGMALQTYYWGNHDFAHNHQHNGCGFCGGLGKFCIACGDNDY